MLLIFLVGLILEARRAERRRAAMKSGRLVQLTQNWLINGGS